MGITWCRERLEQAQNSKNPVDRILIRCTNVMKPKTYARSQDRLADDILYRGIRKDNLQMAPPRSRGRSSDWQACALTVPDEPSVAPVPPPRKKRKRKMNADRIDIGSGELDDNIKDKENVRSVEEPKEDEQPSSIEQRKQNRFIKLSENKITGKIKMDFHPNGIPITDKEDRPKKREPKMRVVKNVSTVSLPNYNDLVKPTARHEAGHADDKSHPPGEGKPPPRRNQSTVSLPGEASKPILSTLSEATIHRLEMYMKRCRSFGSLKPHQLLEKLEEFKKNNRSESESSDSWSGLDDWDLGVIEYCDPEMNASPLMPRSTIPSRSKIFSLGTPQELSRRQSPVSEVEEEAEEEPKKEEAVAYDNDETVPTDWFSESAKDKLEVEKTKTPPPSPANGLADPGVMEKDEGQSSLLEILKKYKEEEIVAAKPEVVDRRKLMRHRSRSLIETNPDLLQVQRMAKRSPSISLDRTSRLLDELSRNSEIIEKEFLANPEQVLNGLRRASMCENLPEDPFEIYLSRKKTSLRESLSEFMGFVEGGKDGEECPPPLPKNPPPIITMSPPEACEPSADGKDQVV